MSAAKAQIADGQFVVRSDGAATIKGVSLSPLKQASGSATIDPNNFSWHFIEYQHVKKNATKTPPQELLRQAPADFPDAFSEATEIKLEPNQNQPIWVQVGVPEATPAGEYSGEITIKTDVKEAKLPVHLTVYDFVLPTPRLLVTVWMNEVALAKHQKVELFSEPFWAVLDRTAKMMREHHQNVVLTPWSLIAAHRETNGNLALDFSKFDRWVNLFLHNGMKFIEISHLGGREHGQWEDKNFVAVQMECKNEGTGKAEKLQIEDWLPLLEAHVRDKGWTSQTMIHVADEPTPVNSTSWRKLSERVHKLAPSLRRIDAIQCADLQNDLEVWVPSLQYFDVWPTQYAAVPKTGAELWFYTAWVPQEKYPNRLMDYPLIKTRMLHWINYTLNTTGYLHWGLNQWDVPFDTWAPGDNWIIWPGKDQPRSSIRYEAMRAGIEDFEYLKLLEDTAADAAKRIPMTELFYPREWTLKFAHLVAPSLQGYTRDPAVLFQIRDQVAHAIEALRRDPAALRTIKPSTKPATFP
jgi:hypothetical protein